MIDDLGNIYHIENDKPIYDLASIGWHKKLTVRILSGKEEIYEKVRGKPTQLKKSTAYILREYSVSVKPCPYCEQFLSDGKIKDSACRIKIMPSSVFRRCFLSIYGNGSHKNDATFMENNTDDSKMFKLLSEKTATESDIINMYKNGHIDIVADLSVRHMLENRLNIQTL
jgi:hypothetical protein